MKRRRMQWLIITLIAAIIVTMAALAQRSNGSEFEFLLLIEKLREEETQEQKSQEPQEQPRPSKIQWVPYGELFKAKFPDGAIVFVGAPKCAPCEEVKRNVLANERFQKHVSHLTWTKAPVQHWKKFQQGRPVNPPFLVSVLPGGRMQSWLQCPILRDGAGRLDEQATVDKWIEILPRYPRRSRSYERSMDLSGCDDHDVFVER